MLKDNLLRISLIFIAVLIIIGFFAINYVLKDGVTPKYTSSPVKIKVSNTSTDEQELSLDTIFINIRSQKYKILKADIALKMKSTGGKKALQSNMENVRNSVLQYLNSMESNGLETPKGKDRLKEELISMLESNYGQEIETIYFKNFILSP